MSSDAVWTKSGSPYSLTGNTAVNSGVTLTIELGVTVNLNGYYIRVNGTLTAKGTSSEKITFNGGQIVFTAPANGWSEQTQTGCIIQNAIINQMATSNKNPIKIDSCTVNGDLTVNSAIVTNNVIIGNINSQAAIPAPGQTDAPVDTSVISYNNIKGNIVIGSVSLGAVTAPYEAPTVSSNIVEGSIISGSPEGTPQIFNNMVSSGGIGCSGYGHIYNNTVYGCQTGIRLYTVRVFGGNLPCFAVAENNYVNNCSIGIGISISDVHGGLGQQYTPTIQYNTVAGNGIGISLAQSGYNATPIIRYNNLQRNYNYSFYLGSSDNADVSLNWWGTTDDAAISQSIYDFKNDFNLGTVTYRPILTAFYTNSPADIPIVIVSPPVTTPTSIATTQTTTPTPTPTIPELTTTITLTTIITLTITATILHKKPKNNKK